MFHGSDNGGQAAAVLTSLIATCKRLKLDPFAYLRDLFGRISSHPQSHLAESDTPRKAGGLMSGAASKAVTR